MVIAELTTLTVLVADPTKLAALLTACCLACTLSHCGAMEGSYYSLHRTAQTGANKTRTRSGRPQWPTEQEDKYIRVSRLRNRHLTSSQLEA